MLLDSPPAAYPPLPELDPCCASLAQASIWENTAVLSNSQQHAIDVIGAACSQRAMPKQVCTYLQRRSCAPSRISSTSCWAETCIPSRLPILRLTLCS